MQYMADVLVAITATMLGFQTEYCTAPRPTRTGANKGKTEEEYRQINCT